MIDLSVVILTHNEEIHLHRALKSISRIAKRVFIIDSGSTDASCEIARTHGAIVLKHGFINYAQQFQWGIENAQIDTEWVMRLDADEIIEDDLAQELLNRVPGLAPDVVGINLDRKHIFMDRWVRHGGRFPLRLLRIWRHGKGRIEDRWMDEHMVVWGGRTVNFSGGFADHNL
ncbi:MAG: glycosyltransferase family 2 protein, partial [Betaproteobacteria bacterium HGW-Betaproteobacteria-20]